VSHQQAGLLILGVGLAIALIGLLVWAGGLSWFGKLPGDIRIEGKNATVFIPIASMIVVSLVLSVGLSLLLRIFRR
jgi:hypothetical protein